MYCCLSVLLTFPKNALTLKGEVRRIIECEVNTFIYFCGAMLDFCFGHFLLFGSYYVWHQLKYQITQHVEMLGI